MSLLPGFSSPSSARVHQIFHVKPGPPCGGFLLRAHQLKTLVDAHAGCVLKLVSAPRKPFMRKTVFPREGLLLRARQPKSQVDAHAWMCA